ncbi:papilin isoform X2 [Chrysoperla carnea]|uniref:papilin isoform X2 n=1 Tax=Chrysoperla carnea TaxID=189513 RepID=UPI001D063DD7|nr:papilin isoform X2 [Chrysoperla carnea]
MDLHRLLRSLALLTFVLTTYFSTVLSRHYFINNITDENLIEANRFKSLHLRFKRQQGAGLYLPDSYVTDTGRDEREEGPWGPWSGPSECSRTCGGGVSTQRRECTPGYRCTGPSKKHFSCNTQDCPDDADFREQQCAKFNSVPFEGVTYDWIPYTKAPNKCELNCMPRGERFYYRHSMQVIDGTRCDDASLNVCVEGQCQPVGCDMMLGSPAREDKCRQCVGDGSSCNTVTGLLDSQDLQAGYNDILLIPAGATNIHVYEVRPSNNYLAIRNATGHYYLNGNWRIDFPKTMRFAGTLFLYERNSHGFPAPDIISCVGPTTEALYIVLLLSDVNVGVKYEYSIPKDISSSPISDTYNWIFDSYSDCSASCGGGTQSRRVYCVSRQSLKPVDDKLCDAGSRYPETQACNTEACPATWREGPWSNCTEICGSAGTQTREVVCERVIADGIASVVDDKQCSELGLKPKTAQECNREVECPKWHIAPWKACDQLCGKGKETRAVTCYRKLENGRIEILEDSACESTEAGKKPESEKECELKPCKGLDWITSEWSNCDSKCGPAQQTRRAYCATNDGEVYPDDLCTNPKPELVQDCPTEPTCDEFLWFSSDWSECSAKCGQGKQTRIVFCGSKDEDTVKQVEADKCDQTKKLETVKNCTAEVDKCTGEWFAGPWSTCSKECGGGLRERKVLCKSENKTVHVKECNSVEILYSTESCNTQSCDEDEIISVDVTKSIASTTEPQPDEYEVDINEECDEGYESDEDESSEESEDDDYIITVTSPVIESSSETPFDTLSSLASEQMFSDAAYSSSVDDEETSTETNISDYDFSDYEGSGEETTESLDKTSEIESSTLESELTSEKSSESSSESSISSESSSLSGSEVSTESVSEKSSESSESSAITPLDSSTLAVSEISSESASESSSLSISESSSETVSESSSESVSESSSESVSKSSPESSSESASESVSESSSESASESSSEAMSESSSLSSESTSESSSESSTETSVTESTSDITTDSSSSDSSSPSSIDSSDLTTTSDISSTSDSISSTTDSSIDISTETKIPGADAELDPEDIAEILEKYKKGLTTESSSDGTGSTETSITSESESSSPSSETTDSSLSTDSSISSESSVPSESSVSSESSTLEVSSISAETSSEQSSSVESSSEVSTESSPMETSTLLESSSVSSISSEISSETTESTSESSSLSSESSSETVSSESVPTSSEFTSESSSESSEITSETVSQSWESTILSITKKLTKICRKKKSPCKNTKFGCCSDKETPAAGPFQAGCPTPKTCNETKHGCCPDGVSVAKGSKNKGCPKIKCAETLFGCCPDNVTAAEGNDNEGCKKEPPPPECASSKFGCCSDNVTKASGPDEEGCPTNCSTSEFGCCPDGIQAAIGENQEGCYEEGSSTTESGVSETPCDATPFGCCPDGGSAATGENYDGCGIINHENCTISYYGCCPDNKTAALGVKMEGCKVACDDSPFGCCPDLVNPAHGHNQEGCCLSSPFGCCPDNTSPARGPNQEGCDCEYSRFGCCPDNTTAAIGPNNEGCGCEQTRFGCCPDTFTEATGPNFEGCPCHSFQFGCCDDGVTVASGPRKQGCGCLTTEFKCCPDEKTPASGPNFEGCDCTASKFGCCPDGVTNAEGDNFEGCTDVPVNRQEACKLSKDRGNGRNYTVKWYYDMEYGGCSRFWYGGEDGNDNRFVSQEECRSVCVEPQGKDVCNLPKVAGACEGYYPTWYYDKERKQCTQFIYGGCLGNNNRFKTREECLELCAPADIKDVCQLPKEEGPCNGRHERWYYNAESDKCDRFLYGGCKGNGNNFNTEDACSQKCLKPGEQKELDLCHLPAETGECYQYTPRWYYDTKERNCRQFYYGGCGGNENNFQTQQECEGRCEFIPTEPPAVTTSGPFKTEFCFLPSVSGSCSNQTRRFYYDSRVGVCQQFLYTGCEGNQNNFETIEECHRNCANSQDLCTLPKVEGPCDASYDQWYYNKGTDQCEPFVYGGCAGNTNRFNDQQSCEQRCQRRRAPDSPIETTTRGLLSTLRPRPEPQPQINRTVEALCYSRADPGQCSDNISAWFYNPSAQRCDQFVYTGCGGNENRYESEEACERSCGRFRGQDVCRYPKDTGTCRALIPKYYFDYATSSCQQFNYGGCGGNGNRFSSLAECESICSAPKQEVRPPVTQGPALSREVLCTMPLAQGNCGGGYKRWFYDDERGNCIPFIYTGCSGNENRFRSFEDCINYCVNFTQVNAPTQVLTTESPCRAQTAHCESLKCPYGVERRIDEIGCEECLCYDPCREQVCPSGSRCVVDLKYENRTTIPMPQCRLESKPGQCPLLSARSSIACEQECYTDADCRDEDKCCANDCGSACVSPTAPEFAISTEAQPAYTEPPVLSGVQAPTFEETEPQLEAEEGYYVTIRCVAHGFPIPRITWRKGAFVFDRPMARIRLLPDGSLQIVNVLRSDAGVYICVANNGVGHPLQKEFELRVIAPTQPRPARIFGDEGTQPVANLGSPYTLYCYAMGWPTPHVQWWHGDRILPLDRSPYEQSRYFSLTINPVELHNLGTYTCHAYNGFDRASSWDTTLFALGPVYSNNPNDINFFQYIKNPPDTTNQNETTAIPTQSTIEPTTNATKPPRRVYKVPVRTNITLTKITYAVGEEISIPCNVDGYPIPRVQWFKDNRRIEPSTRFNITEGNRLMIIDAKVSDSGEYRCEAENQYSRNSSSVDIRVQGIYVPPGCKDNPFLANCTLIVKANYCSHKYYQRFCCESCVLAGQLWLPPKEATASKRDDITNII